METDTTTGKPFLKHEYNRDGDSYRSPWSNTFFPASPDATFYPSAQLRQLEQKANEVFTTYCHLYYDYATSSVYVNDSEQGFSACFLVKKEMDSTATVRSGTWDAMHIVDCNMKEENKVSYKVFSTVMISLVTEQPNGVGKMEVHGNSSKTSNESVTMASNVEDIDQFHLASVGRLIEQNEDYLRN